MGRHVAEPLAEADHGLAEDHNGDPVCKCGWNPARYFRDLMLRENGRARVRRHALGLYPDLQD